MSAATLATLIRVRSCLAGAVVCFVGVRIGDGGSGLLEEAAAVLSVVFVIAFAQVVNDIIDMDLDEHDKPDRPLPSGQVSTATARALAATCAATGTLLALVAGPHIAAFALVVLALSWAYSRFWKDTVLLGNLVVATLASSTVLYGALASGASASAYLLSVQAMVFSVVLAHEVVKTTRDVEGDAAAGLTTVATRFGVKRASRLAAALCVASVLIAILPALHAASPALYLAVLVPALIVPSLWAAGVLATRVHAVGDIAMPFGLLRVVWGGMVLALLML